MKFCPQCGTELKEGSKFCPSCGYRIASPQNDLTQSVSVNTPSPTPVPPPVYQTQQPVSIQPITYNQSDVNPGLNINGLIQRAIRIISNPKQEWLVIGNERPNVGNLIFGYTLVLTLIPAISTFLAYGFIGVDQMGISFRNIPAGVIQAFTQLISSFIGVYLFAWIVDLLAGSFGSEKNFGRSLQLAVYSTTAQWIAGIFLLFDGTRWLSYVASLYAIYLVITGLPVVKRTPPNLVAGYVVVILICVLLISVVISFIILSIFGLLFASRANMGM